MDRYLKYFDTHSEYQSYITNGTLPNVSYCDDNNEVHIIGQKLNNKKKQS